MTDHGNGRDEAVAIVGAGAAGAGAAYALRDTAIDVTVFEKSRGVCGRAATRRKHGCRYDHGANYFKDEDARVTELVTEDLDTEGLAEAEGPVWTFDADGTISEGRDADDHKWTYRAGITQLAKRLFDRTDATIEKSTRVGGIEHVDGGWTLADTDGTDLGRFDSLLLTPPAPQTADLLAATEWNDDLRNDLETAVRDVSFRPTITAVLHYPFELDRPYYALVNTDKDHEIGWCSREECKPGHVPDGESLLIVQLGADWSADRIDDPPEGVTTDAADLTADLLNDDRLADPDWTDFQGWRYAQPGDTVASEPLDRAKGHDLFFAGDWVAGEGRVHLALRNGLDTGERIADRLES
ncbi:NAD(P)/FAD-dependent oxidoreductase [Halococcus agarilyticus]|uniref:NAD(P)/FAD-dependent oxidoreductase n=1 Tax=Halococcus agarilyticus TaxID=1232219 RepID=UPI0006780A60|nr:FAD-dependent oxidoreductase [Halococcus agarilyticus]